MAVLFWRKAAKHKVSLFKLCGRLDATHPVISRHLITLQNPTARLVAVALAQIRQHRQKRHTKRAGEAGVSSRAGGWRRGVLLAPERACSVRNLLRVGVFLVAASGAYAASE